MKLGDKVGSLAGVNGRRRTCERLNLPCEGAQPASFSAAAAAARYLEGHNDGGVSARALRQGGDQRVCTPRPPSSSSPDRNAWRP